MTISALSLKPHDLWGKNRARLVFDRSTQSMGGVRIAPAPPRTHTHTHTPRLPPAVCDAMARDVMNEWSDASRPSSASHDSNRWPARKTHWI